MRTIETMLWVLRAIWSISAALAYLGHHFGRGTAWWDALVRIHQEFWPFGVPGIVVATAQAFGQQNYAEVFFNVLAGYWWWTLRDWPSESPWKRRGRRMVEQVRAVGGKLVVQPLGAVR